MVLYIERRSGNKVKVREREFLVLCLSGGSGGAEHGRSRTGSFCVHLFEKDVGTEAVLSCVFVIPTGTERNPPSGLFSPEHTGDGLAFASCVI